MPDPWSAQMEALGAFIRSQRKRARLSQRSAEQRQQGRQQGERRGHRRDHDQDGTRAEAAERAVGHDQHAEQGQHHAHAAEQHRAAGRGPGGPDRADPGRR